MNTHLSRLDFASREYLWDVWQKQNANGFGVLVGGYGNALPSNGIIRTIFGLILIGLF